MQQQIQIHLPKLIHNQSPIVVVEAGHIYTNEHPTEAHFAGAFYGAFFSHYIGAFGVHVKKWVFIDNYNPTFEEKPLALNIGEYVEQLSQKGYAPDCVAYEADLVTHAKEALEYLCAKDYAMYNPSAKRVILKKDGIPLYNPENGKYMCAFLDACLYQEKLSHAGYCVTFLEETFAQQQKVTGRILGKLGVSAETIYPLFYTVNPATGDSALCNGTFFQSKQPLFSPSLPDMLNLFIQIVKMKGTLSFSGVVAHDS